MSTATLEVYLYGNFCGHLVNQGPDSWGWQARSTPESDPGLIWSLRNITSTSINPQEVRCWFRALLPEAAATLRLALKAGVSPGNDFALLGALANDCQGAVTLALPGRPAEAPQPLEPLAGAAVDELVEALREGRPGAALAGALWPGDGAVAPMVANGPGLARCGVGKPANVLLRAGRYGLPEALPNEAFCTELAGRLGLPVAGARFVTGPRAYLLGRRPDTVAGPDGRDLRLHLETFGQLAGLAPELGYEREGGLALLDCAGLIRRYSIVPALDLRSFLRWVGFNLIVGNGLASAGSLRFLFTPNGPRLAPFTDLLSTHVYPDMSDRMGFFVGHEDRPDWLVPARWRELAGELGVAPRYLLTLLRELALATGPSLEQASTAWRDAYHWSPVLEHVAQLVGNRARRLWVALEAEQA